MAEGRPAFTVARLRWRLAVSHAAEAAAKVERALADAEAAARRAATAGHLTDLRCEQWRREAMPEPSASPVRRPPRRRT